MAFPGMKSSDWDAHSKEYAALNISGPMHKSTKALLSALNNAAPLSSATAILDVGCGPGTSMALLISEYGLAIPPSSRIIASDYSKGMVECVQEFQKEKMGTEDDVGGCWSRLEPRVLDAQDLKDVEDGGLSHVMGSMVYFMLPNPRKGLEEAFRVLKDGGALSLSSMSKADWIELMYAAAKNLKVDVSGGFDLSKIGGWRSTQGLKEEFESCGFRDVKTEYVEMEMPMKDPSMFVNGFIKSNNPGAKMFVGGLSSDELDRVCEEWVRLVGEQGNKVKGIIIVATGKK